MAIVCIVAIGYAIGQVCWWGRGKLLPLRRFFNLRLTFRGDAAGMRGSPFLIGDIVMIVAIVLIVPIDFFFFGEQCGEGGCYMGVSVKKEEI